MKDKYSGLSTEEQLKRYRKENKTLLVSAIICSIVIVVISILFFVYELDNTISVGFLVLLPFDKKLVIINIVIIKIPNIIDTGVSCQPKYPTIDIA